MDEPPISADERARRQAWFEDYVEKVEQDAARHSHSGGKQACPCCRFFTLDARAAYEICSVCFWEDDGQDDPDADDIRGGPNGALSLTAARTNYVDFGACERRFCESVRPPTAEEKGG